MTWKYTDQTEQVVFEQQGQTTVSLSVHDPRVVEWMAEGNTPLPPDPPPLTTFAAGLIEASVRTTDAQPTELYRMTLPALTGVSCDLVLIGVDTGNGACRILRASFAAKRLNAGAVGIPQAQITYANHQDTAASSWAITPSTAGNDLVLSVTGAAGRTIDWSLSGAITTFTPSGR